MREPCYKCKFEYKPIDREPCEHCSDEYIKSGDHPAFQWAKRPTNYDLLIRKTPEELAGFLAPFTCPPIRFNKDTGEIACPENKEPSMSDCEWCVLDWLKQEAET